MVSVPLEGAAGPFQGVGLLATLAAGGGLCCESGKCGIRSACCRFGLRVGNERVCAVIKSLWASVQGDPVFVRRVNGWFTIFWILMIPVSIVLGLLSSVAYVSALSLWALASGHWSASQAARVEVEQQTEAKALEDDPIEERVGVGVGGCGDCVAVGCSFCGWFG